MNGKINPDFISMLLDSENALSFQELFDTALRIVANFDRYGEVLQSNDGGMYDESTDIEKLRGALFKLDPELVSAGDYAPWLTEEQQRRLSDVAAEVVAWGNGENIRDISCGIADVEIMLPRERIEAIGYYEADANRREQLRKRLGFDPDNGKKVPD